MKLVNDFFKILSVEENESKLCVRLELNPAHDIFKGHFPGNPVVPGVCMVQMIKETLESVFQEEYTMKVASQLKFLAIMNPELTKAVDLEMNIAKIDFGELNASGTLHKEQMIFLKFKAVFSTQKF